MKYPPKRRTLTYIVRVWAEYLDGTHPRWCGEIEVAGCGEKVHFTNLEEITDFIRQGEELPNPDRNIE